MLSVDPAEGTAPIYFRNSIAIAFPSLVCPGSHDACEDGDDIEIDLEGGCVINGGSR